MARQVTRLVAIWIDAEVVGMVIAMNIVIALKRPDLMLPAIIIPVGLHFLPLARWLPFRPYYVGATLLILLALLGLVIPSPHERNLLVGIGGAVILWSAALTVLHRTAQGATPVSR